LHQTEKNGQHRLTAADIFAEKLLI